MNFKKPKYIAIYETISDKIKTGFYKPLEKLPNEIELSKELSVSRPTLRQAILLLIEDGVIYNLQGSGTYVSDLKVDEVSGMEKLSNLIHNFYPNGVEYLNFSMEYQTPSEKVISRLGIDCGTPVIVCDRIYSLLKNNELIAYVITIIPSTITTKYKVNIGNEQDLMNFIDNTLFELSSFAKSTMQVTEVTGTYKEKLNCKDNSHFILVNEILYGNDSNALATFRYYLNINAFKLSMTRKSFGN